MRHVIFYHLFLVLFSSRSLGAADGTPFTSRLKSLGALSAPADQCENVEKKLGQLFYVMVSNYGSSSADAIDPAWIRLVQELQVGGVLPHFSAYDKDKIRAATAKLQAASKVPLLIGVDYLYFPRTRRSVSELGEPGTSDWYKYVVSIGLGNGWGFIGERKVSDFERFSHFPGCLEDLAFIQATIHKFYGVNQSLGPTIERRLRETDSLLNDRTGKSEEVIGRIAAAYRSAGMAITMKHFPFEPKNFNLHKENRDTAISLEETKDKIEVFRRKDSEFPFAMTTHLWNSKVDSKEMVTFSKKWIDLLRKDLGYGGLLMTDALFMITGYGNNADEEIKNMLADWKQDTKRTISKQESLFAIRALLAGHDLILTEGTSKDTREIFRDVHYLACQDTPNGNALRAQILTSHERIMKYKKKHGPVLRQALEFPQNLYLEIVDFVAANSSPANMYIDSVCKNNDTRTSLVKKLKDYFANAVVSSRDSSENGETPPHQVGGVPAQ